MVGIGAISTVFARLCPDRQKIEIGN